jgi:glycosyltransferase involved in cell wall biosynthesis
MRLGYHYHSPAAVDGAETRIAGHQGRFLDGLAPFFDEIVCFLHSPLAKERANLDYRIERENVKVVNIGPHSSVPRRMLAAGRAVRIVRAHRKQIDAMLLRGASPLLPDIARAANGLPIVLLLVSSYRRGLDDLPQPPWRKLLIKLWAHWNMARQDRVAARALTFVNSREIYRELEGRALKLVQTQTTTLNEQAFFEREDTCVRQPVRLLYVGRMETTKGLLTLVEALALLVAEGMEVGLELVGSPIRNDPVLERIGELSARLNLADRVKHCGYKPLGPELFRHYRKADIFVLASLAEGFPRSIWEAMAHSLPVVSAAVGSIPDYLQNEHDALLVSSREPKAYAEALRRVITDAELRRRLIRNGRAKAKGNTLEVRSREMALEIQDWVRNCSQAPARPAPSPRQ